LTCVLDAKEERDIAVIDIPNAFIQTRVEDERDMAIIKIRGTLIDILVDIAPAFTNITQLQTRRELNNWWFDAETHSTVRW
jgi:hypothetical protein